MNVYKDRWNGLPAIAEFYSEAGMRRGNGPKLKVCVSLDRGALGAGTHKVNRIEVQDNARVWLIYRPHGHSTGWCYHDCTLWREGTYAENVTDSVRSKLTAAAIEMVKDLASLDFLWRECEIERLKGYLEQKKQRLAEMVESVEQAEADLDVEVFKDPYTPWEETTDA